MVAQDTGLVEEGGQVMDMLRHIAARLYQMQMELSGQQVRLFARESAAEAWFEG